MSQINKAPPFLELSSSRIQNFDTTGLDIENVLSIWTGLTKCSNFISNGKRLENISWRIVNRNLVNHNKIRTADKEENRGSDVLVIPGSYTPLKNKLNQGDFKSLLSIVADEGLLFQRPALNKKKSSNKNLTIRSKNNRSNESFENLIRPSMFRKSSSSKSLKKLNQKKKSTVDLPSIHSPHPNEPHARSTFVPTEHDSDLFEQPNPRLSFGVFEKISHEETQPPALTRSATSTSIVRGFDPNQKSEPKKSPASPASTTSSISSVKSSVSPHKSQAQPQPQPSSLFAQHKPHKQQPQQQASLFTRPKPQPSSLFTNQKPTPPHPHHQHYNHPVERVKSPLSKESLSDEELSDQQAKQPASLFQSDHKQKGKQSSPQAQKPKTLFEQVGISPDVKKPLPTKAKRNNVLNNLGMTSLIHTQHHPQQQQLQPKLQTQLQQPPSDEPDANKRTPKDAQDKSMFFIESSPSPTDSIAKLLDHNGRQHSSPQLTTKVAKPHPHHHHSLQSEKSHSSRENSARSNSGRSIKKKSSLFADHSRQLNFSSDSSLSEESDWSSVSETDDEEYDNKLREQWDALDFKRKDESLSKPQIKRSLLSGLFLNEMPEDESHDHHGNLGNSNRHHDHHDHHLHHHHQLHQPQKQEKLPSDSQKSQERQPQSQTQFKPLNFGPGQKSGTSTPGNDELSSSVASNIHIKHRHNNSSNEGSALELSTIEPHSLTSTSNVNVAGLVNEPHRTYQARLQEDGHPQQSQNDHQRTSSFTSIISKSALNLTNYFAHQRKNSFSSLASDRTRVKFKHESNAPPTASTILPTALSTHMFLPNAHQKAKSRLAAVVETTDSSQNNSRKSSTSGAARESRTTGVFSESDDEDDSDEETVKPLGSGFVNPVKSPVLPIPKKPITLDEIEKNTVLDNQPANLKIPLQSLNISRKLSPKTTRRQMLATELSDSLRKSILWDRKLGLYPAKGLKQPITKSPNESNDELVETTSNEEQINDRIVNNSTNEKVWEEEDTTDFYTRGW